jgi:hypothetical protein
MPLRILGLRSVGVVIVGLLIAGLGLPGFMVNVAAQSATAADLARLDASANVVTQQVAAMKKIDPVLASQSEKTLGEINEDLTYLKVKLRREGNVAPKDVKDLADRIETLHVKLQASVVKGQPINPGSNETLEKIVTLPVGTELDVRLQTALSSATAKIEQRFEATTIDDLNRANLLVIPAGSVARGFVSSVTAAGRLNRKGSITLSFDQMVINGSRPPMRASLVKVIEGNGSDDAKRVGAGAVAGAIIGGMLGGGKGALAGVMIGAGGTVAATEGANAELPVGTVLRIRLDQPLEVTIR